MLILDDVFAELDTGRRERLADLVAGCEQVLITAAVEPTCPALRATGTTYAVSARRGGACRLMTGAPRPTTHERTRPRPDPAAASRGALARARQVARDRGFARG